MCLHLCDNLGEWKWIVFGEVEELCQSNGAKRVEEVRGNMMNGTCEEKYRFTLYCHSDTRAAFPVQTDGDTTPDERDSYKQPLFNPPSASKLILIHTHTQVYTNTYYACTHTYKSRVGK